MGPVFKQPDGVSPASSLSIGCLTTPTKRHKESERTGRPSTLAKVVLRMLVLKHVRVWSDEQLPREMTGNFVYRWLGSDRRRRCSGCQADGAVRRVSSVRRSFSSLFAGVADLADLWHMTGPMTSRGHDGERGTDSLPDGQWDAPMQHQSSRARPSKIEETAAEFLSCGPTCGKALRVGASTWVCATPPRRRGKGGAGEAVQVPAPHEVLAHATGPSCLVASDINFGRSTTARFAGSSTSGQPERLPGTCAHRIPVREQVDGHRPPSPRSEEQKNARTDIGSGGGPPA
jgi:hypothetical protein